MLMHENVSENDKSKKGSVGPPTLKRAGIDEESLIADAIFAYAVSIGEIADLPTASVKAMANIDVAKWRDVVDAELRSQDKEQTSTPKPRRVTNCIIWFW